MPMRHTALIERCPTTLIVFENGIMMSGSQIQILAVITAGIMERHRAIHLAMHKLMHKILVRSANFIGRSFRHDHAIRHEIDIIHDLQRLLHIVRHH